MYNEYKISISGRVEGGGGCWLDGVLVALVQRCEWIRC